jgi:hypothetical protein
VWGVVNANKNGCKPMELIKQNPMLARIRECLKMIYPTMPQGFCNPKSRIQNPKWYHLGEREGMLAWMN